MEGMGQQPETLQKPPKKSGYTATGFVPEDDGMVYVQIEKPTFRFDGSSEPVRTSKPQTIVLEPQSWAMCRQVWASQGFKFVKSLHLPSGCEDGFTEPKEFI